MYPSTITTRWTGSLRCSTAGLCQTLGSMNPAETMTAVIAATPGSQPPRHNGGLDEP